MPDNKKHHYVPRFYLKRFSHDGKSIGLYNLNNELKIPVANLKNQCYKNYFYGKEQETELALSEIEGQAALLLLKIDTLQELPPPVTEEYLVLLIYILIQHGRTKYSADTLNEMNDKMVKQTFGKKFERDAKKAGIENFNLDDFLIHIENVTQYALSLVAINYPLLLDLDYKLLINSTDNEFITSDNPVVLYNPFMLFRKLGSNTGLAAKGLTIFFPISPNQLIIIYDYSVYRMGNDRDRIIKITNDQDIYSINALQACSCYENIYFQDKKINTKALHRKVRPHLRIKKATVRAFPKINEGNNETSQLIMNYREDLQINVKLSFMGTRRSAKKLRSTLKKKRLQPAAIIRNEKLVNDFREFEKALRRKEYQPFDFFGFLKDKKSKANSRHIP